MRWCFGILFVIAIAGVDPSSSWAQVDCVFRTVSVSRVQGTIVDPLGEPIANAEVKPNVENDVLASAKTDDYGRFIIPAAPGKYELHANARGFYPGFAPINVGSDLVRAIRPTHLWMILEVGLPDTCPLTTTSRREFNKATQEYKKKH
jgi:hypothetical protein